jgi:kynurenine formamidase
MKLTDLTLPWSSIETDEQLIPLRSDRTAYTGVVYDIRLNSMTGSYIDFPGHIRETDDGMHAGNYPLTALYRVPATLLRPKRSGNGITADELAEARGKLPSTECIVIHGKAGTDVPLISREIYLTMEAVDWIIDSGCRLLVSDTYESESLDGVFLKLFGAGISTVCMPVNLDKLNSQVMKITVFTPLLDGIVQVPCRIVAETE